MFSFRVSSLVLMAACSAGRVRRQRSSVAGQRHGKVLIDGQPLEGASVFLKRADSSDPKFRRPSRATTNAQGEFSPKTYGDAEGLPVRKVQGRGSEDGVRREAPGELQRREPRRHPGQSAVARPQALLGPRDLRPDHRDHLVGDDPAGNQAGDRRLSPDGGVPRPPSVTPLNPDPFPDPCSLLRPL